MTTYIPNTINSNGSYTTSTGGAGSVLTSNGAGITGNTVWATPHVNFNNGQGKSVMSIPHGENKVVLEDTAELEVKGRVRINGQDLEERLTTIEKVLMIPERDVILEKKYPKLKKLYNEYIEELSKYRTWDTLKDSK